MRRDFRNNDGVPFSMNETLLQNLRIAFRNERALRSVKFKCLLQQIGKAGSTPLSSLKTLEN